MSSHFEIIAKTTIFFVIITSVRTMPFPTNISGPLEMFSPTQFQENLLNLRMAVLPTHGIPNYPIPPPWRRASEFLNTVADGIKESQGFLISGLPKPTSCDYMNERPKRCLDCHHAVICMPGNIAIVNDCSQTLFPHCLDGFCSPTPDQKCLATNKNTAKDLKPTNNEHTIIAPEKVVSEK